MNDSTPPAIDMRAPAPRHSPLLLKLLFLSVGLIGGYIISNSIQQPTNQMNNIQITPTEIPSNLQNAPSSNKPKYNLLSTKKYGVIDIGAYVINSDSEKEIIVVAPKIEDKPYMTDESFTVITAKNYYSNDNLFDIIGEKLYIVNQISHSIDVYTLKTQSLFPAGSKVAEDSYHMNFLESYAISGGDPYQINCENTTCTIRTATNQESGCSMMFDTILKKFSESKCTQH